MSRDPPKHPRSPESPQTPPRCLQEPPDASQMHPRCLPDASQFPPYQRCVADGLNEIPGPFAYFHFFAIKMTPNGLPMEAQMGKMRTNRQTKHEKRRPENLHMEMTKQGETQALQSLIFEYPLTRNRSFNFSRIVENVFQKAPKTTSKLTPAGDLAPRSWQERGYKKTEKQSIRKVRK